MMTIREYLFHNFTGCSNHDCVITGKKQAWVPTVSTIEKLVTATAEATPGVYTLVYEEGGKGFEFTENALKHFVELVIEDCLEQSRSERLVE